MKNLDVISYCTYNCKYAKFQKNTPVRLTFDVIHYKKYQMERNKGSVCLDYNEAFQKVRKKRRRK